MSLQWTQVATVQKGGHIEVVLPLLEEGAIVEVVVRQDRPPRPKPRFGSARGQGETREDFDEPLNEFSAYR